MILKILNKILFRKRFPFIDRVGGVKKDKIDKRDHQYQPVGLTKDQLPKEFSLSKYVKEVKSQGSYNSCVSHAICSAFEVMLEIQKPNAAVPLSERYHYYYGRKESGKKNPSLDVPKDNGQYPREALKALFKKGVCPEFMWQYYKGSMNDKPTLMTDIIAHTYKQRLFEYVRVYSKEDIKESVYLGVPILLTLPVYNSFMRPKEGTAIKKDSSNPKFAHEVLITGWNEDGFEILNSWGLTWAEYGYATLDYKYPTYDKWIMRLR